VAHRGLNPIRLGARLASCVALGALLTGCGARVHTALRPRAAPVVTPELGPAERLERAENELAKSEYSAAEADFRATLGGPSPGRAALGLARVLLLSGRYQEALQSARSAAKDPALAEAAACVAASALRAEGRVDEAVAEVTLASQRENAWAAQLMVGELELARGHRKLAEPHLMALIEAYNDERISEDDGDSLALAARAAWLLRSPKDANTLFIAAEHAKAKDPRLLLWRAELFLEKYDPANAEEVLREFMERAPGHPQALTLLAQVRLDQALDFDEAERLARAALSINPRLASAHFVLAGIALRDMELEQADQRLTQGLAGSPNDLTLLSMRAVVRFLAADEPGFREAKRVVLEKNPEYTKLYAILGEYADWEHRYDEIVKLMREALTIDNDDASALAQLGLNLIRAGNEREGVAALSRAFSLDPYNVRVYNTLGLFDTLIPKSYVSVTHGPFVIRYHKDDRAILERYVPALLEKAYEAMRVGYGFTPETPTFVELYAERENFAVRTSGLPQTAIQGVCFGRTLAAVSPQRESFNLGMTLWHELSHVFHIQLSKSRVPRWFTEGLAEYETLVTRPEWSRQHDAELFELMRAAKLPSVGRMSRAFTRAEALSDIATAYYASSKIVEMLANQSGRQKMAEMLRLWGEGLRTEEVFQRALGVGTAEIDQRFRTQTTRSLTRYTQQFVPLSRARPLDAVEPLAQAAPKDAAPWVELGLARLRAGDADNAMKAVEHVLTLDPKHADARFLLARIASDKEDFARAAEVLQSLVKDGFDGYQVDIALAELARARGDSASARAAFELATRQDPTQAEPLQALADIAAAENVPDDELVQLEKLAPLSPHQPSVYRRLLRRLLDKKRYVDAVKVGEAALWADVNGLATHVMFAEALAETSDLGRARYELESALLCPAEPIPLADAHVRLAEVLLKTKQRGEAKKHAEAAKKLDPTNQRLRALKL
jgi:Flp pilus assembly protein TadD